MSYDNLRRPGTYVPPLIFTLLCLVWTFTGPNLEAGVFYGALAAACAWWLWRSLKVHVELTEQNIVVRTTWRTTRLNWATVDHAGLRPMRTASPLKRFRSYPALAVWLTDGRVRQFDDVSAPPEAQIRIADIVAAINTQLSRGSSRPT